MFLKSSVISKFSFISHGFGKRGADLNTPSPFTTEQIHSDIVYNLDEHRNTETIKADAFIASKKGVVCFVRTADCVPILIVDPVRKIVGAVHAGWRGTSKNIVEKTILKMSCLFGTDPNDCAAAIGPHICGKCYEVGHEVIDALGSLSFSDSSLSSSGLRAHRSLGVVGTRGSSVCVSAKGGSASGGKHWDDNTFRGRRKDIKGNHIDLGAINYELLKSAGVPSQNIDVIKECTFCNPDFASYRRDPQTTERQINFILLCK